MKWKAIMLSILMVSILGVYADSNVYMELTPNMTADVGDTFNLTLVIKDIPSDDGEKCAGVDATFYYNDSLFNLTNIEWSSVADSASLKEINLSEKFISLAWLSNPLSGNFTLATLTFKKIGYGDGVINLKGTISNEVGYAYKDVIYIPAVITQPKCDLTITNISANLVAYQQNIVNVSVKNIGAYNASNISIDLYDESNMNQKIGREIIDFLNAGESKTVSFPFTPETYGNCTLVAVADPNNTIAEENESNNKFVKTFHVVSPDPAVVNISIENSYYREPTTINITVSNVGDNNSGSFNVNLYANSDKLGTQTVQSLSIGETKVVEFNWTPNYIRNYTLVATISSPIKENPLNDKVVKNVQVIEKPITMETIPSSSLVKVGNNFTVDIKLENITNKRPARGFDGVLVYNQNVLNCTNFTFLINSSENLENITFENGKVYFSIMCNNITTPTIIARASFKAIDVGNSNILLENTNVSDAEGYAFNNIELKPSNIVVEGPNINVKVNVSNPAIYRTNNPVSITITNNGHEDITQPFDVRAYVNSDDLGNTTISSLKIGESKTLVFNWTPNELRKYTIVVVADSTNSIKEENESDNKVVKEINTKEIPVLVKLYNISEENGSLVAKVEVNGVSDKRPCGGYDLYISLKNLSVVDVDSIGTTYWKEYNDTLFITGYNFSKSGDFEIGEIKFNITNSSYSAILTNTKLSDTGGYNFLNIGMENDIISIDYLKSILNMTDAIEENISGGKLIIANDYNMTQITLNTGDVITIPMITDNISINESTIEALENITKNVCNIKSPSNANDVEELTKIINDSITSIMALGFNLSEKEVISNIVGNEVTTTIQLTVENTSNKGFATIAIPIGDLSIKTITLDNGTTNISLKENDYLNPMGWYEINNKVLKITVVKDPKVTVVLATTLPSTSTPTSYHSSSHHSHATAIDEYSDIAKDIKSEKLREFVHNATIVVGSNVDNSLSARDLKNTTELINKPLEIKEDCILIGGPVANPLVKQYLWTFKVKITNEYPGANKGVIQKQIINGHTVILLAGSDRYGTKAAVEYFKTLDDIPDEPIFVEWKDGKAVKIEKP